MMSGNAAGLEILKNFKLLEELQLPRETNDDVLAALKDCTALKDLLVQGSEVSDIGMGHLAQVKSLKKLLLTSCPKIGDLGYARIAELTQLEDLILYANQNDGIGDEAIEAIATLKNLKKLEVRNARLTDLSMERMSDLSSLEELILSAKNVTDAGIAHLVRMKSLRGLSLSFTQITDIGMGYLARMESLANLHLFAENISDVGVARLKDAKSLRELSLFGHLRLTDHWQQNLGQLSGLRYFSISAEGLPEDKVKEISQALPHIRILTPKSWLSKDPLKPKAKTPTAQDQASNPEKEK
jgi:Leucine-rich repeat (LRR) protein